MPPPHPPFCHLRILETDIRVDFTDAESARLLADSWSRCLQEPVPVDERHRITEVDADSFSPGSYLVAMRNQLTHLALGELDGSHVVLEGFGLADRTGRVIAVVGETGPALLGQVIDLARTSHSYVTQGPLVVDPDGRVVPLPGPVAVPSTDRSRTWPELVGPDRLGLNAAPPRLRLASIVVVAPPAEGALEFRLRRLPDVEAVVALASRMAAGTQTRTPVQRVCEAVRQVGGVSLLSGSSGALADVLEATLTPFEGGDTSWETPIGPDPDDLTWRLRDGRVRRVPWQDAVLLDGEAVVSIEGRVVRLGPLGSTLWRAAGRGASLAELTGRAVAEHGPHPHAEALVTDAVEGLSRVGAVSCLPPHTLDEVLAGGVVVDRSAW